MKGSHHFTPGPRATASQVRVQEGTCSAGVIFSTIVPCSDCFRPSDLAVMGLGSIYHNRFPNLNHKPNLNLNLTPIIILNLH